MAKKGRLSGGEVATTEAALCRGTSVAYGRNPKFCREPHPMGNPWGDCWKCHLSLGCSTCTIANVQEVLCERCAAWGTKAAFHHHGPIMNTPEQVWKRHGTVAAEFREYPDAWKVGYEAPHLSMASGSFTDIARRVLNRE